MTTITCDLCTSPDSLEPAVLERWDMLAIEARRPYCAPAWQLAWWRHAAADGARLRVLLAREGERLVGVAPFYAMPWAAGTWSYALLGSEICAPVEPLASRDRLAAVATAFARALAGARPRPGVIRFGGVPAGSPWPGLLGSGSGRRRGWIHTKLELPAPAVTLASGDVDAWLSTRSANFRQRVRRARRALEREGAVFRSSTTPDRVEADVARFARLHLARWRERGGSTAMLPGVDRMLVEAGRALADRRRFRICSIEVAGEPITSVLLLAAGDELSYWNSGFDGAWQRHVPTQVALVEAIRAGLADSARRLDLGAGDQPYKYRFADSENTLVWLSLIPPGRRHAVGRLLFAPEQTKAALSRRLAPEQKDRLRALARLRR